MCRQAGYSLHGVCVCARRAAHVVSESMHERVGGWVYTEVRVRGNHRSDGGVGNRAVTR